MEIPKGTPTHSPTIYNASCLILPLISQLSEGKPTGGEHTHRAAKCRSRSKYSKYRRGSIADLTRAVRNGRYVLINLPKHPYPILLVTSQLA